MNMLEKHYIYVDICIDLWYNKIKTIKEEFYEETKCNDYL